MEKIKIKTLTQLNEALLLRQQVFIIEQDISPELEYDQYDQLCQDCTHVMLKIKNQVVAAGRYIVKYDVAKLQRICVDKNYRGQGIGQQLIKYIEMLAIQQNLKYAKLDAQLHAVDFLFST